MDPFFGFHIGKGIARNVNNKKRTFKRGPFFGPQNEVRLLVNCEGFCCSVFAPDTRLVCLNIKFFAGLNF